MKPHDRHFRSPQTGRVFLTGAGPGDPDLITLRGANVLAEADVIVYDRLANPELLKHAPESSEKIYVGKKADCKRSISQKQINDILVTRAREGKKVVRLKGGDPFVFGRGGEECQALRKAGVPYEVIPGISSAIAAPAYAGIPVTHRKRGRSFTVVTGHTLRGAGQIVNWESISGADTLVILMGLRTLPQIVRKLTDNGRSADTPAAVVAGATLDGQTVVTGTLKNLAERAAGLTSPATIIVGELATMHNELTWFETGKVAASEPEASSSGEGKVPGSDVDPQRGSSRVSRSSFSELQTADG